MDLERSNISKCNAYNYDVTFYFEERNDFDRTSKPSVNGVCEDKTIFI